MPGTGRTYYVAGAGIAGLTLALALAKFGANVIVLERNSAVSEFGAGLQVSPNARRILNRLGLDEAITTHSLEPSGIDVYPHRAARPLVTLELGQAMRDSFGAPYAVMHRADLAEALYMATRRFANIDVMFGVRSWDVASHVSGVTVTIEEAEGQPRTVRGHAFIGADGVHSVTRRQVLRGVEAQYRNRVAWRTLLPFEAATGQIALDRVSVLLAANHHMVCYPLPHRKQVNIAFFAKGVPNEAGTAPALHKIRSPRIRALLAAADSSWSAWPLYTVDTPTWHTKNVGLIGDAAHAMVPFQAQGAAMAIEDAAVLAPLLINSPSAEVAFARYEQIRRPRVTRVARTSSANGTIFHMPWPLSFARDLVIASQGSTGHLKRLSWLYGHDAEVNQRVSPAS